MFGFNWTDIKLKTKNVQQEDTDILIQDKYGYNLQLGMRILT